MKTPPSKFIIVSAVLAVLTLLALPGMGVQNSYGASPPVEAALVREGDFALKLVEALGMGQAGSETEAESMLGAVGIAPRNGWIADYPVTPDIIGELRDSISYAAQTKTISMDSVSALKALEDVQAAENLSVVPAEEDTAASGTQTPAGGYPDQTVIDNYYYDQGPPVVTYYAPPADYYYLYSWVPYPFWWGSVSFGGYFILNDFHKHVRRHGHSRHFSNHFNDTRDHRVFRIDPVKRNSGRTYSGIGAPKSRKFLNTGRRGAGSNIFNSGRDRSSDNPPPPGRIAPRGERRSGPAANNYRGANPFQEQKVYRQTPHAGGRMSPPPAQGERRGYSAPSVPPSRGDGTQRGGDRQSGGGRGAGRDMRR
ncbi:MAG: hypothetical protein C0402_10595 [Thermodesulfovibrio sp.]|nr:hypothetical protein [Thermodesulfovibrio sp.]